MKKLVALLLVLLMAISTLTAFADEALFSDERTLKVAITSEPVTMDPIATVDTWSGIMFTNLYESLLKVDEDGKIVCHLAESYEQVDDTTYDFKFAPGTKFHNGEELKASDVVFCFKRSMEAPILQNITDTIQDVVAIDDYTVRFTLKKVSAAFMSNLCHYCLCVYSQKAVEEYGEEYYKHPCGTGPYKLDKWDMGNEIVISYFEDYRGATPDFTKIIIRTIPEATNRAIELEAGSVDFITDVAAIDYSRIEDTDGLALATTAGTSVRFMGMNCSDPLLQDVRVRQAIAYAIDADAINRVINMGKGVTATAAVSPAIMFHSEIGKNVYDVEKAKALLAEAGYPDGIDITLSTDTRKEYNDVVVILQQQLAKANIRVTLNTVEWAVFLDNAYAGKTQLFMLGYGCATPDPDTVYYPCFHSSMIGYSGGMAYLQDAEVDALIDAESVEMDVTKRAALYEQLQAKLAELKPWVPLYNTTVAVGYNSNKIKSLVVDGCDIQRFFQIYK